MKFLAVTDIHYSDRPLSNETRRHALSLGKLAAAENLHGNGCEFVMCLGDVADSFKGWLPHEQGLERAANVLNAGSLKYHVMLGNHDTATDKNEFCRIMGMKNRYYSFNASDCKCIVLDTCMNSKTKPFPQKEIVWDECYVDSKQLRWLKAQLESAKKPVVVFAHSLLAANSDDEHLQQHVLRNAKEVNDLLIASGKVCAVFSGHYHEGLSMKIGDIPYTVFSAMCDGDKTTCAVVEVADGRVAVEGFGNQKSIEF